MSKTVSFRINADTSQASKAMDSLAQKTKNLNNQGLAGLKTGLGSMGGDNADASLQRTGEAYEKLSQSIDTQNTKLQNGFIALYDSLSSKLPGAMRDLLPASESLSKSWAATALKIGALTAAAGGAVYAGKKLYGFAIDSARAFAPLGASAVRLKGYFGGNQQAALGFAKTINRAASEGVIGFDKLESGAAALIRSGASVQEAWENVRALANVAAGNNIDIDNLTKVIAMVQSGKVTGMGEALEMSLKSGVPILEQIAKRMGVAKEEVLALTAAGKVSKDVFIDAFTSMGKEGGEFFGKNSELSNTFGGTLKTISGYATEMSQSIGEGVAGVATPALQGLAEKVKNLYDNNKGTFLEIGQFLGDFTSLLARAASLATDLGSALMDGLRPVVKIFSGLTQGVQKLGDSIGSLFGEHAPDMTRQRASATLRAQGNYEDSFTGSPNSSGGQSGANNSQPSPAAPGSSEAARTSQTIKRDWVMAARESADAMAQALNYNSVYAAEDIYNALIEKIKRGEATAADEATLKTLEPVMSQWRAEQEQAAAQEEAALAKQMDAEERQYQSLMDKEEELYQRRLNHAQKVEDAALAAENRRLAAIEEGAKKAEQAERERVNNRLAEWEATAISQAHAQALEAIERQPTLRGNSLTTAAGKTYQLSSSGMAYEQQLRAEEQQNRIVNISEASRKLLETISKNTAKQYQPTYA